MYLLNIGYIFLLGRLDTFESVIPNDSTLYEKQEALEGERFNKLSDLNIFKSDSIKDLFNKKKDSFKNGNEISIKILQFRRIKEILRLQ